MSDDIDDYDEAKRNRLARKVRAAEFQRNPTPAVSAPIILPRRRPPPEPAEAPVPRPGPMPGPKPTAAVAPQRPLPEHEEAAPVRPASETQDGEKLGYGNPPTKHRFKKGQSGNPRGRPKQSRSLKTHLLKILDETVEVNEQGRLRKMTRREVIARQTVQLAMKGNLKSLAIITAFDPVDDNLPAREEPLTEHETEMLAHYLGISPDQGAG